MTPHPFETVKDVVTAIRKMRHDHRVPAGRVIPSVTISSADIEKLVVLADENNDKVIRSMARVGEVKLIYSGSDDAVLDLIEIAKSI